MAEVSVFLSLCLRVSNHMAGTDHATYMHLMYVRNTDAQMSKAHSYDRFACCYLHRAIPTLFFDESKT